MAFLEVCGGSRAALLRPCVPLGPPKPVTPPAEALYVRVVRRDGPQLSLIDLPGVTHNAEKMSNIHEVGCGWVYI